MNRNTTNLIKGFTLIELLVVISVIALLVSILIPALGKAKDHAKRIGCSANLRSLAMAVILYADGNGGLTPSSTNTWDDSGVLRGGWCGQTSDTVAREALDVQEQVYGNGIDEFTGLHKSQLWNYIETIKAWRCPTDPDRRQLRSYCMAAQWWGKHTTADNSVWYDPGAKVYKKIGTIKSPSQRFLFVDAVGYNLDAYFAIWYSESMWWNILQFNHGGGSVNGFADGHAEYYKLDAETIEMAKEGLETGFWTGYKMPQVSVPNSDDLKYYQRATWGKSGW
jgi:prepilin-type N-terminal cleavage/methylation domain-containing protein